MGCVHTTGGQVVKGSKDFRTRQCRKVCSAAITFAEQCLGFSSAEHPCMYWVKFRGVLHQSMCEHAHSNLSSDAKHLTRHVHKHACAMLWFGVSELYAFLIRKLAVAQMQCRHAGRVRLYGTQLLGHVLCQSIQGRLCSLRSFASTVYCPC